MAYESTRITYACACPYMLPQVLLMYSWPMESAAHASPQPVKRGRREFTADTRHKNTSFAPYLINSPITQAGQRCILIFTEPTRCGIRSQTYQMGRPFSPSFDSLTARKSLNTQRHEVWLIYLTIRKLTRRIRNQPKIYAQLLIALLAISLKFTENSSA